MGKFRVTANFLMSFGLFWGIVILLYGRTSVADTQADFKVHVPLSAYGDSDPDVPGSGGSGRTSAFAN
mgnify:CR=1 FL=1